MRLQEASDRAAANLVELEIDSSRQLLDVSTLTGRSADRWSQASAALTDLWRWQGQLKQLLERAEKLRGPWRANELRALLDGESIELTRSEVPLAERDLLGQRRRSRSAAPPEQLLERMSGAFDEVKTVVARFGRRLGCADSARERRADGRSTQAQALAAGLGEHHRRDLDEAARAVARLAASASADPLSTAPGDLDRLIDSLHEIRRDLDATAALRREFDARLADARGLLASLETTAGEGRAAHEEALVKISVPTAPEPPAPPDDLGAELDEIAALARSGAWREARHKLDAWTSRTEALLDEARQAAARQPGPDRGTQPVQSPARGLPGEGAAARASSRIPELEQIFARAHEALYTAPTDLALVAQLVRRYQERISPRAPPRRCRDELRARRAAPGRSSTATATCAGWPPRDPPAPAPAPPQQPRAPTRQPRGPGALTASTLGSPRRVDDRAGRGRARERHLGRRAGRDRAGAVPRPGGRRVRAAAVVPESRRFCRRLRRAGRARPRRGARAHDGVLPQVRNTVLVRAPSSAAGVVVAGQYEVVGCLAHGGMGWVYLARDRNVADRWVVLKGLLDSSDDDAMAAALAERRFLAEVEHPNIVKIFNFVQHDELRLHRDGVRRRPQPEADPRRAPRGQRRRARPAPAGQAIAYMLEILPALGYLHRLGLLFCDFKLDNVIQTAAFAEADRPRRRVPDGRPVERRVRHGRLPGAGDRRLGPSVASDLFTVARTLAVLCFDFRGTRATSAITLPPQETVPVLARYDSLYQFLLTGTAPDPDDRFQSAEEMADQLYGVLREVVSGRAGRTVPAASTLFTGDSARGDNERPTGACCPVRRSTDDPAAGYLATITRPTRSR